MISEKQIENVSTRGIDIHGTLTAFPLPEVNAGTLSTAVPRLFGGGRGYGQSLSNTRLV